ncbi:MAG: recombination protein RecA [Chloroflexota bacterium]|jgi:recombination protein RecA|nr:recombination protein RecA [Chloroflexota bacterium]
MQTANEPLANALARLQGRWGTAAIRLGNGDPARVPDHRTAGALALAPAPELEADPFSAPRHDPLAPAGREVVSTGFPQLDAALGSGGLPRQVSAAIRGDLSSGKTTLALRCLAEAQGAGAIGAWLDLGRAFDPLEAVARGVDLRWLIVIRPADAAEGFAIAAALLTGRAVDLLIVDLPAAGLPGGEDKLRQLAARAQRADARLIVLEPASPSGTHAAAESTGLRLELDRRDWIRLGRDVIGQQTQVTVAKNRFGPPGRQVALEIHYADAGERALATHRFAET